MKRSHWRPAGSFPGMVNRLALLVLLGAAAPAWTQGRVPFAQDTHGFRYILQEHRLTPLGDLNSLFHEPGQSILIVFGDTTRIPPNLKGFVNNGGAVFVATDKATGSTLAELGIEVTGTLIQGRDDPNSSYRGSASCPYVQAASKSILFVGLKHIATNNPSFLATPGTGLVTLDEIEKTETAFSLLPIIASLLTA
jgi:hypothetical protein